MKTYEFHPLANIFPLIDGKPYSDLMADVLKHGVREPVWLYEGKILDGRNRYRAATAMKVKCDFRQYEGKDAVSFVISLNLHRRHLNEAQRAMVAAKLANLGVGQHKSANPQICGSQVSQAEASELLNVSTRSTQFANQVLQKATPELAQAVERGEIAVTAAAAVATLPKSEQAAVIAQGAQEVRQVAKVMRESSRPQKRLSKTAKGKLEELDKAKSTAPASMLIGYARMVLKALREHESFSAQEREVLGRLRTEISEVLQLESA